MKNMLVILPWIPYPLKSGGNQAVFNGIQSIKDKYNVSVFCIDYMPWRGKKFLSILRHEFASVKMYVSWDYKIVLDEIVRKVLGKKFDYKYLNMLSFRQYSSGIIARINEIIKQDKIDCVQIEMFDGLSIVEKIPLNMKKIFVHHEIRFLLGEQILNFVKNTSQFLDKLNKERNKEIALLNKFDLVITLSESDKVVLEKEGLNTKCYSSFAAVSSSCPQKSYSNYYKKKLAFVGPEQHLPNKEGLLWFLEKCWNDIKKIDDEYSLNVVGFWSEGTEKRIKEKYKDVCFCGFVENLADLLNDSIMIVPIFAGSGIRMKILESAQMRVPFVSTSIGNSGLLFESERDCLIADDSASFVKAIFRMENDEFRKKITNSAYEVFAVNYSLSALKENRLNILKKI